MWALPASSMHSQQWWGWKREKQRTPRPTGRYRNELPGNLRGGRHRELRLPQQRAPRVPRPAVRGGLARESLLAGGTEQARDKRGTMGNSRWTPRRRPGYFSHVGKNKSLEPSCSKSSLGLPLLIKVWKHCHLNLCTRRLSSNIIQLNVLKSEKRVSEWRVHTRHTRSQTQCKLQHGKN